MADLYPLARHCSLFCCAQEDLRKAALELDSDEESVRYILLLATHADAATHTLKLALLIRACDAQ